MIHFLSSLSLSMGGPACKSLAETGNEMRQIAQIKQNPFLLC